MEKYVAQLLADIELATDELQVPWIEKEGYDLQDWLPPDEDRRLAPKRSVEDWTLIKQIVLPPADRLTDQQTLQLLEALKTLLHTLNCIFAIPNAVPVRLQYETIRRMWRQEHAWMQWHPNLFEVCETDQVPGTCALGIEYCHCHFYAEMAKNWDNSPWTEEDEERLRRDMEERERRRRDDWWD